MESESDSEVAVDDVVEWIEVDDQGTLSNSDHDDEDVELEAAEIFDPPHDDSSEIFASHRESVFCLGFDSSGRYLVSGGQDHVAIVWDVLKGEEVFRTQGHDDSITCASFSPDDYFLATGDMAGHIFVWLKSSTDSSCTWVPLTTFSVGDLLWLRWWKPPSRSTKSRQTTGTNDSVINAVLLAGDEDGLVNFWPVSSNVNQSKEAASRGKCIAGSGEAALDAQIIPSSTQSDRPKLIVLYRNGDLRLWDLKSTELLATTQIVSSQTGEAVVFSLVAPRPTQQQQDQRDLVIVAGMGLIYPAVIIQNQDTDFQIKSLEPLKTGDTGSVEALDCSWTHPLLGFATVDGALGIIDYRTMSTRQKWIYTDEDGNGIGITNLAWSHFAPVFFTSTVRGSVVAWPGLSSFSSELSHSNSHNEPTPLRIWWGHRAMILDLVLPPNMSISTTDERSTPTSHMEPFLATCSDDTTIRLFPLTSTT